MANIRALLTAVDELNENAYSEAQKLRWLNELEGKVQTELLHKTELRPPYTLPEDEDTPLLVPFPYDELYRLYLLAMLDFANGEFSHYQNSMIFYNNAYGAYAKALMREKGYQGAAGTLRPW